MTPLPRRRRRPSRGAAILAALTLVLGTLGVGLAPTALAADRSVDLVANVGAFGAGASGQAFSHELTVKNLGPEAAPGTGVSIELTGSAAAVTLGCAAGQSAACPTDVKWNGNWTAPDTVTATIAELPSGGSVVFTVNGTYPELDGSFTTKLTITPPDGFTEADPVSNTASRSASIASRASVTVTHSIDKPRLKLGETATYTRAYTNTSAMDVSGWSVNDRLLVPTHTTANTTTVCGPATTDGVCPEALRSGLTVEGAKEVGRGTALVDLPAGATLELVTTFSISTPQCLGNVSESMDTQHTFASNANGRTVLVSAPPAATTTVAIESCAPPTATLSLTAPSQPVELGQEFVLDSLLTNSAASGEKTFDLKQWNFYLQVYGTAGVWKAGWSATTRTVCNPEVAGFCPEAFKGDGVVVKNGVPGTLNGEPVSPFKGPVDLAYGEKIALRTYVTLEPTACIARGEYAFKVALNGGGKASTGQQVEATSRTQPLRVLFPTDCDQPNVDVQTSVSADPVPSGAEQVVTTTYVNRSATPIMGWVNYSSGISLSSESHQAGAAWNVGVRTTCDSAASTAGCPSWATGEGFSRSSPYDVSFTPPRGLIQLPAHSTLVLTSKVTASLRSCPASGTAQMRVTLSNEGVSTPAVVDGEVRPGVPQPLLGTTSPEDKRLTLLCSDAATSVDVKSDDGGAIQPNAPATVTATFTNTAGVANGLGLKVALPARGLITRGLEDLSCTATTGIECPDFVYDEASRSFSAIMESLPKDGKVTVKIAGRTGVVPLTAGSYTVVASTSVAGDMNPASDRAVANFGFSNDRTPITLTFATEQRQQEPAAARAARATFEAHFTGVLSCDLAGDQAIDVTLSAGVDAGEATYEAWKGDRCTVRMDEPAGVSGIVWQPWEATPSDDTGQLERAWAATLLAPYVVVEDPNTGADADPNTGADADPNTGADADPNTGADADPNTGADADPNTGADADPNTGADADPNTGADADPNTGADADPNTGADADPNTGADADPSTGADPDPEKPTKTPDSSDDDAGSDPTADADGLPESEPATSDPAPSSDGAREKDELSETGAPVLGLLGAGAAALLIGGFLVLRPRSRARRH